MTRTLATVLPVVLLAAFAACQEEGTEIDGALRELTPDCLVCLEDMTECTSTAKNEEQFLGCRDLFQECQATMNLGPDECGRPSNQIACELCKTREDKCEGEACRVEFSVCKTFLMSRDQERCSEDEGPPPGDCDTCVGALADCGFGGESAAICENTFASCKTANKLSSSDCPAPSVTAACDACLDAHAKCEAATGEGCDAGWTACVETLATEGACGAGPSNGAGGGGGGGGGPGPSCPHDACEEGAAMSASCDSCIASVCELDPYCCTTAYDATCVAEAASFPVCGCAQEETCAHDECETGGILDPGCSACAETVCAADGFCCNTSWDEYCVQQAVDLCGKSCG